MDFPKFDINKLAKPNNVLILGRRCTGRTTLLQELVKFKDSHTDNIAVAVPDAYYTTPYKTQFNVTSTPESTLNELLGEYFEQQKENPTKEGLLVLDDIVLPKDFSKNRFVRFLTVNNRYISSNFYMSISSANTVSPELRANTDYVFICKETNPKILKSLHANFGQAFSNFEDFKNTHDEFTKEHGCMVISQSTDQVYWYKPESAFPPST